MQKLLQFVANICLLSAISLAQTTGKVTVNSPVSGSTVVSPVHFVASAQAPANRHITAMERLRAGTLSPTMAAQMWQMTWRRGAAELHVYTRRERRSAALRCPA